MLALNMLSYIQFADLTLLICIIIASIDNLLKNGMWVMCMRFAYTHTFKRYYKLQYTYTYSTYIIIYISSWYIVIESDNNVHSIAY